MKKILALLLAVLIMVSFAACGGKTSDEGKTENQTEIKDEQTSGETGIANPWIEASADEIYGYIGCRFGVPEGATNVKCFWNEQAGLAEMQFTYDEIDFTARAKKTDELEDISGMNYDFIDNSDNYGYGPDCFIRNNNQELRGDYYLLSEETDCVSLGLWLYGGAEASYSFSLGYVTDKGFCDMSRYASEVFILDGAAESTAFEEVEDDPLEYSREFWEAKYPGENICPFYIEVDGTEYSYYCLHSASIAEWIEQEFNWNGWHFFNGDESIIVNEDETYRITELDMALAFSSFCTYHTEKFDKNEEPEEFTYGEVTTVKGDSPLALKGIKLVNRTTGEGVGTDYAMEGLISEFRLDDWIEVYLDAGIDLNEEQYDEKVHVFVMRHRNLDKYADIDYRDLSSYCQTAGFCFDVYDIGTEEWNFGNVGSGYVSIDAPAGDYDLLIYYEQDLCCRTVIKLESAE